MFLNNEKNFLDNYLCIDTLVIQSDSEYGYHIYVKHGYMPKVEFSFTTESKDLVTIINEINHILLNRVKNN